MADGVFCPNKEILILRKWIKKEINPDFLGTFTFDSPNQYIMTETDEFSAVCPFSGLPDLAYVKIEYYPEGGKCSQINLAKNIPSTRL